MNDIVTKIARDVFNTVWTGVQDVFSSAASALVAVVVAILLSILPVWFLVVVAAGLFAGIIFTQYHERLDKETEE